MLPLRVPLALSLLLAACAHAPPPAPTIKDVPSSLVRLGDDMRHNGDANGAMNLYRSAAEDSPHSAIPLERMGEAYAAMGDRDRAEQSFRAASVLDPTNPDVQRGLAVTLLAAGRPAEALPTLQSLARTSSDPALLRDLGTALDMLGRNAEAQRTYRRGLTQAPADADLHGNLALSLAISGNATAARTEMQAAVASPLPDPRQEANAVLILALLGETQEARDRGDKHLGPAATDALLARAAAAREAPDAAGRALALGVTSPKH